MRTILIALMFILSAGAVSGGETQAPILEISAPAALEASRQRLLAVGPEPLLEVMELLGLEEGGPPIQVLLAAPGSPEDRHAPPWVLGYAFGNAGQVVLLPGRTPGYPDDTLESVFIHEVAHVLVARAAGRNPVPRWFNEGLAMLASRPWTFSDEIRLLTATLHRERRSLASAEEGFSRGANSNAHAYAVSGAFVRDLEERNPGAGAHVLSLLARGLDFEQAFSRALGRTLAEEEERFFSRLTFAGRWVPVVSSANNLWIAISLLALLAYLRRRQLDAEQRQRWLEEEQAEAESSPREPTDGAAASVWTVAPSTRHSGWSDPQILELPQETPDGRSKGAQPSTEDPAPTHNDEARSEPDKGTNSGMSEEADEKSSEDPETVH